MKRVERRTVEIDLTRANGAAKTVEAALSSEFPVERSWGREILLHEPSALVTDRAPFPLLVGHDSRELPVGVVENLRLENRRLKGTLRFSDSAKGKEIWEDVKSGILRSVSVGYQIHEATESDVSNDVLVRKWELLEVSLVSVPADHTVGIGRSLNYQGEKAMTDKETTNNAHTVGVSASDERSRITEMLAIEKRFSGSVKDLGDLTRQAIDQGWKLERYRQKVLEKMGDAQPLDLPSPMGGYGSTSVGLYGRELDRYSVTRAINALSTGDWSEAGLEREASIQAAKARGKKTSGLIIPFEVLGRNLTVGTLTAGGNLVGTEHLAGSFIEMLRNSTRVMDLGATILQGLEGDIEIPKQTGSAIGYWVAEDEDITLSQQAFGKVEMAPKTLGALTTLSRKLLVQSSPAADQIVKSDLARVLAIELDRAAINGSGINSQPTGILNTTGVNLVTCGDNGAVPTYANILSMLAAVANDNAESGSLGFLTNSKVRSNLMLVDKGTDTGAYVWEPRDNGDGNMVGYRALVSNNVPSNLDKGTAIGVLSAILYGNWADLMIGFWGNGIEIEADPYGSNFAKGAVSIRAMTLCDIAVRNPESFAAIEDAATT